MIKASYLRLLHLRPARLLLRRWRAEIQKLCGYSDPFFELAGIARNSNSSLFIDIGCHKGETLLRFLESGIKCPVAAFEPFIESLDKARELLKSYPQISYFPVAASDNDGFATFYRNRNEQTSSLLENDLGNTESFPEDTSTDTRVTVPTVRLDTWAIDKPTRSFAVIKCDTQGAEGKVVRGGLGFIRDKVAAFYCEVMLGHMYRGQASFDELSALLEGECGMVLRNVYPCLHDARGRAVQFDALWVKPQFLPRS
jgi:FkbM family methyltransferase